MRDFLHTTLDRGTVLSLDGLKVMEMLACTKLFFALTEKITRSKFGNISSKYKKRPRERGDGTGYGDASYLLLFLLLTRRIPAIARDAYLAPDVEIFFRHAKALKVGKILTSGRFTLRNFA